MKNPESLKQQGDIIWNIANLLRGPYRPPQYRRVMIPLTVLRRLDCVLEKDKDAVVDTWKRMNADAKNTPEMIEAVIKRRFGLSFFNTSEFTFQKLLGDADKLAANLNRYIAGFSSKARRIIEKFKFEEEIEKLEEANRLYEVIKEIATVDLHPDRIPNIEMGYLFEDLVRRFNEQANEEAGDHFTPREVIRLMVSLLFTDDDLVYRDAKVLKIYDPTCGTGGMLSESEKYILDPEHGLNPGANLELFGQEYNPESHANHIATLTRLYAEFRHDVRMTLAEIGSNIDSKRDPEKSVCISKIFDNRDFGYLKITVERPLRLNFRVDDERIRNFRNTSFFVSLAVSLKRKDKARKEEEILEGKSAQAAILAVLEGMKPDFANGEIIRDRAEFAPRLDAAFAAAGLLLDAKLRDALLAPGSLGEKDPAAEICHDRKGQPEPDADLRDFENVPLPADIPLPLPLGYEGKKNKGKVDVQPLLKLVRDHCEAYLKAEVLPYRPDAWIDHGKIKVGYEIPFNRHFYEYEPPRPLAEIEADIAALEGEIVAMLKEITA